jgi:hypothetical protein
MTNGECGSLKGFSDAGLIESALSDGRDGGYRFEAKVNRCISGLCPLR